MSTQSAQEWANQSGLSGNFSDYRALCAHLGIVCHKTQSGKVALSQAITQARKKSGENSVAVPVVNQENSSHTNMYTPPPSPTPVSSGAAPATESAVTAATLMQQAITLLGVAGQPSTELSAEQVAQVQALIAEHSGSQFRKLVVEVQNAPQIQIDIHHSILPRLIPMAAQRSHTGHRNTYLYLWGPAGTGKSELARNIADAHGLPFASMSFCAKSSKSDLIGYMDMKGEYISTPFYTAYKDGGVFCLDEIDSANPNLVTLLNGGVAGTQMSFPCGMVRKHPDFYLVCSANTFGTGANEQYIGRNPMDAASMDRVLKIYVPYCQQLESALYSREACEMVWAERKRLEGRTGFVLSMRAIYRIDAFLRSGMPADEVYNLCIHEQLNQNLRK
jgi:hypothetical protein